MRPDLVGEAPYPLLEARAVVLEVDDEAVGACLDVLREPLRDPLRRAGDRVPAPFVSTCHA